MNKQPEALRLADELEMWTLGEPAAAELRRLYQLCMDQQGEIYALKMARSMEQKTVALVAAAEREACAKLVFQTQESDDEYVSLRETIALAIRARGILMTQSTHSADCYKWHHECAIARIEEVEELREALKAALAEPEQIPPEAQTEAEKVAYCAGWWAAMQKAREVNKPVAYRFQSAVGGWAYGSEPPIGSKYPVYPLYAAPQTEVKHAVPILQKQATKTHGNPTVPAEMWVYAEYLKAHPEQAKEFFQRAGILDTDGNLTEQYK